MRCTFRATAGDRAYYIVPKALREMKPLLPNFSPAYAVTTILLNLIIVLVPCCCFRLSTSFLGGTSGHAHHEQGRAHCHKVLVQKTIGHHAHCRGLLYFSCLYNRLIPQFPFRICCADPLFLLVLQTILRQYLKQPK